jgi:hypothetical protein
MAQILHHESVKDNPIIPKSPMDMKLRDGPIIESLEKLELYSDDERDKLQFSTREHHESIADSITSIHSSAAGTSISGTATHPDTPSRKIRAAYEQDDEESLSDIRQSIEDDRIFEISNARVHDGTASLSSFGCADASVHDPEVDRYGFIVGGAQGLATRNETILPYGKSKWTLGGKAPTDKQLVERENKRSAKWHDMMGRLPSIRRFPYFTCKKVGVYPRFVICRLILPRYVSVHSRVFLIVGVRASGTSFSRLH